MKLLTAMTVYFMVELETTSSYKSVTFASQKFLVTNIQSLLSAIKKWCGLRNLRSCECKRNWCVRHKIDENRMRAHFLIFSSVWNWVALNHFLRNKEMPFLSFLQKRFPQLRYFVYSKRRGFGIAVKIQIYTCDTWMWHMSHLVSQKTWKHSSWCVQQV